MAGLQPPPPFLNTPGPPTIAWKQWKGLFETYMIASNSTKFGDERRRALLLHCLGPEGQRVYHTLPPTVTPESGQEQGAADVGSYEEAFARLDKHFSPAVNVVAARYQFRQRAQRKDELVEDYVSALRELAINCEFGKFADEFIRDQLVEKTPSERIRERLLIEPALTLQTALTITRQMESAARDARVIDSASATASTTEPVHAVGRAPIPKVQQQKHRKKRNSASKQQNVSTPSNFTACYRCGKKSHKANDESCKAREAKCNTCGIKGHFAKVCRSRQQAVHHVSTGQSHPDSFEVLTIHPSKDSFLFPVTLNDSVKLDMVFDTGSPVSIIPIDIFDKHFTREALLPPRAILTTFLRDEIPVIGMLAANVSHGDLTVKGEFFVAERGSSIMGRDLMELLHVLPKLPEEVNTVNAEVCGEFKELFSGRVGLAKGYVHRIKVKPEVKPVTHKLRRLPFALRDKVSAELARLEKADIIEKVDASEWISPLVVVHKKSGDIRLCVDLREVNKAIVEDKFPLPNIQDLFAELRGASVFSSLDLASAYHQVLLHEESRDMTTFITHDGLFRFKRVCFGLSSAPSAFQKLMSSVLRGLSGVQCYLDDVIVYGSTQAEHDLHLREVLERLQSVGLSLNPQKCQFNLPQIRYLGHIVSAKGMEPDPSHVEAIRNAPVPTDVATLRSFLGLASYYSRFVPHFSTITEPLRMLTRKDVPFAWTPEVQHAFDKVKEIIANSVTLHLFDPDLPAVIATDASAYGLGAVLLQQKEGTEVPVAFASRTLSEAERNYSVGEKEALACVWACEKWFQYIWGRHFILRTDHQSLTTLLSSR